MKNPNTLRVKNWESLTKWEAWTITADLNQYDNSSIVVFHLPRVSIVQEFAGCETYYTLLTSEEREECKKDNQAFLLNMLSDWNLSTIEKISFGLTNATDLAPEDGEECCILRVGCNCGYTPISWVNADNEYYVSVFSAVADAEKWIEDEESSVYYCGNNEAGRPDYYIVASRFCDEA